MQKAAKKKEEFLCRCQNNIICKLLDIKKYLGTGKWMCRKRFRKYKNFLVFLPKRRELQEEYYLAEKKGDFYNIDREVML